MQLAALEINAFESDRGEPDWVGPVWRPSGEQPHLLPA